MNDYPFKYLRPYEGAQAVALYERLVRERFQRLDLPERPQEGRDRGFGGIVGGAIPQQPGGIVPPGAIVPQPIAVQPPAGTAEDPYIVASNHGGGIGLVYHFQGATAGGGGNNEIRVSPYLPYDAAQTKSLWIVPYSGVTAGQFLQVLRSDDSEITNSAIPTGTKLGAQMGRTGDYPVPDSTLGIPVPATATLLDGFRVGWNGGAYIKLRLFYVAPAVALPVISCMLTIQYNVSGKELFSAIRG
jgi:hypothetical protein